MIRTTIYALLVTLSLTVGVCTTAVATSGCSTTTYHSAVVADDAIAQALFTTAKSEQAAYDAGAYSQAIHQKNAAVILKALKAGQALNEALDRWTPGSQPSEILVSTIRSFNDITMTLRDILPVDSPLLNAISFVVNLLSTQKA